MGDARTRIVFRTRGGHKQGLGDIIGSLTIANALKRINANILFIIDKNKVSKEIIEKKKYPVIGITSRKEEISILRAYRPDIIIVNQLNNSPRYLKKLKKETKLLITVDDAGKGAELADLRINPLYHTPNSIYGPSYALVPQEFVLVRKKKRIRKKVQKILVTLGGSDTYGYSLKIVNFLLKMPSDILITVILGPAFRHRKGLKKIIKHSNQHIKILHNLSTEKMATLIADADVVVCSGGNTLYEVACVGTPAIVICNEPFEIETATEMENKGFGINLGMGKNLSSDRFLKAIKILCENYKMRLQMSRNGRKIVDGKGVERIVNIIIKNFREKYEA